MIHRQRLSLSPCSSSLTTLHVFFTDAASLCYNFTVGRSWSGTWSQEVQGKLNEETFISCDNNNNCHAIGLLGSRLGATNTWEIQVTTLNDGVNELKRQVIHMKQETNTIRGELLNYPQIAGNVAQ